MKENTTNTDSDSNNTATTPGRRRGKEMNRKEKCVKDIHHHNKITKPKASVCVLKYGVDKTKEHGHSG